MNNIKLLPSLLIFAEVANKQSFTLAAKQFDMSKSAISQQLKRLEQHIGQQLLSRNTRGMSLTATGRNLLARCELLRDQVDLAFEEINNSRETPSGPFSLSIPHACEREIVIPALNQLCKEFPHVEPNIIVTDEALDLIQNKLDISIYAGELIDSNYRALPIGTTSEFFCAAPATFVKLGQLTKPDDLLQHKSIAAPWQSSPLMIYRNDDPTKSNLLNVKFHLKTNTLPSALELVLSGMGVALLPEFAIRSYIANGKLARVLPDYQGRQWPFYMLHRFQRDKPVHITRFYQLVKHFFTKATS